MPDTGGKEGSGKKLSKSRACVHPSALHDICASAERWSPPPSLHLSWMGNTAKATLRHHGIGHPRVDVKCTRSTLLYPCGCNGTRSCGIPTLRLDLRIHSCDHFQHLFLLRLRPPRLTPQRQPCSSSGESPGTPSSHCWPSDVSTCSAGPAAAAPSR